MKLSADAEFTKIYIESNGPAAFRVLLIQPPVAAADFVNYCKALQPDLDTIRAALKRPYARLDGDYSQPDEIPIPNIDSLYIITRTLAGEAACHWLLHQSDEALNDLTLLHNSCRVLEGRPTGKPMTIRGAMADVNINGLYAKTVANGLRARAWNASQLAALQQQLAEIDLLPIVHEAFVEERVAKIFTLETHNSADLAAIFYATIEGTKPRSWWDLRKEPVSLIIACCPRGWLYQNLKAASSIMEATIASCDPAQHLVYPSEANRVVPEIRALRFGFPSALAIAEVFEILGADGDWKITSHNQTLINQEMIVCALERFHLENRNYPESLDALAPRFLNKIPPDVIGGRTPRYRRLENGQFLLYSTGWDEKDHGGKSSPPDADSDSPEGDVVWEPN
jgi:hypothetical protein